MIRHPRPGQHVRLHYAAKWRADAPLHGCCGVVVIVGSGPGPRNVVVDLGGIRVVVPRGQLVEVTG